MYMPVAALAVLIVAGASALVPPQLPFINPAPDASLLQQLHAAQPKITASLRDQQVHVKHSDFPEHSVRLVKPEPLGCDEAVDQWAGYLDVDSKSRKHHLFFWWFDSRSPSKHVMAWHNGGPVRLLFHLTSRA